MADLMKGKRGLVMGVANERSIAWGIANALAAEGAELAFSYQGDAFGKRVEPLAASVGSDFLVDVDVGDDASLDACFAALKTRWGGAGDGGGYTPCPKRKAPPPPSARRFAPVAQWPNYSL